MTAAAAHEFCRSPPCFEHASHPSPVTVIGWPHQHRNVGTGRPAHVGDLGGTADLAIRETIRELSTPSGAYVRFR
jgi:hypothetical protein